MSPLIRRVIGQMDDELARHHSRMTVLRADLERAAKSAPDFAGAPAPFVNFLPDQEQGRLIQLAARLAARECGMELSALLAHGRRQPVCDARHAAWYAIRQAFPRITTQRIGREFDGRDHNTIRNGVLAAEVFAGQDVEYGAILEKITGLLASAIQPETKAA